MAATTPLDIGFAVFPNCDLLDVTGPMEVLAQLQPRPNLLVVAANPAPISLGGLIKATPDVTFADCPQLDVLIVPGGGGTVHAMQDAAYIAFLQKQAKHARYVMGVCVGALPLAVAGLLNGYLATTHWASLRCLGLFPEITLAADYPRYVISGNRITTGGVSSGIDGSLALAALLAGEQAAKNAQLFIQYAPDPPYQAGSPLTADPVTWGEASAAIEPMIEARIAAILKIIGHKK
jgi:cyclohexyl-isocyanide hydratase